MSKENECLDNALAELRAVGIEPTVEYGGKHIRVHWMHLGHERHHTVPLSPSDWRTPLNNRSQIRLTLRQDGLLDEGLEVIESPHINIKGGLPFCTSLDLARHFEKAHKDVLRSIDRLAGETGPQFNQRNFTPIEYLDGRCRKQRSFDMSRDGFTLLAMGFTGTSATAWKIKYIDAFNRMEQEIRAVAASQSVPIEVTQRIERLEGDLSALIDLSLSAPLPEPGYIVIKAYKRRMRRAVI